MFQSSASAIVGNNVTPMPPLSRVTLSSSCSLSSSSPAASSLSTFSSRSTSQKRNLSSFRVSKQFSLNKSLKPKGMKVICSTKEPLKVMISGAPASGKGTQCEMIVKKFGLVHISTGDLLRSEVSASSEIGNKAKEYMNSGRLVPDEIVTAMVIKRLSQEDAKEKGWLLDGYPRSFSQAQSLENLKIRPDIYIALDVPDDILIDRCVGRRLDPVTGKIYHIKFFPPETDEIKARVIIRPDDTEDKVKSRLQIYKQNAEAVLSSYLEILNKIDGNRQKEQVFRDVESLLSQVQKEKAKATKPGNLALLNKSNESLGNRDTWRGIPTKLNNIPHSREIREYFYNDVLQSTVRAVNEGKSRLKVEINIPELNPEMDVYRIGTLMELVRVLALSFADDGKRVKVCVQGSMGEGALAGMPLQLAGTRKILEFMDWGEYGAKGTFVNIGSIELPPLAVGNCIIDDLKALTDAAGNRPVILINPRLKDLPASSGIMQTMGRDKRLEYAASFESCYSFRLLYYAGTQYPIMGALRYSYPYEYELYKRVDEVPRKEKYILLSKFDGKPNGDEINNAFEGKPRDQLKKPAGFWGFLSVV